MGLAASGEARSSSLTVTRDPVLSSACSFCRVGLPQGCLPFLFSSCLPATPEVMDLRPHPPRTGWADLEHLSILEPVSVVGGWKVRIRVEPASCKPRGSPDGNQSRWVGWGRCWGSTSPLPHGRCGLACLVLAAAAAQRPFLLTLGCVPVCQMVESPGNLNCA